MKLFSLLIALAGAVSLALAGGAASHLDILGMADIEPGQTGSIRTVMTGDLIEEIPLEILGVANGFAGPGRDVIVARLQGARADWFGVVAGMSGSPVIIDGRLVGALAYRIGGFTREAIAGITPIEQMLRIPRTPGVAQAAAPAGMESGALMQVVAGIADAAVLPAPVDARFATPLAISGLHPLAKEYLLPELASLGLSPALVAGAGGRATTDHALTGGDPIAVVLVQGDMSMAGTGTVTLVDGDHVLAMGHPMVRAGNVEFPMARASIVVTVPSDAGSFKLAQIGEIIGAFHQDRPQGLAGRLGDRVLLTPVTFEITADEQTEPTVHHFEMVRTPSLTRALIQAIVSNTLLAADASAVSGTIRLTGRVLVDGREPIVFQAGFPGGLNGVPVAIGAARYVSSLMMLVQRAALREGVEVGLEISCALDPTVQLLHVAEVVLQRPTVEAGGTVRATVVLRDERTGQRRRQEVALAVPRLAAGTRLQLLVGDAAALVRADGAVPAASGTEPDLDELARFFARLRPSDHLYARLSRPAAGLLLETEPMPDLPPSVATVLRDDGSTRVHSPLGLAEVETVALDQGVVVRGSFRLAVTVE